MFLEVKPEKSDRLVYHIVMPQSPAQDPKKKKKFLKHSNNLTKTRKQIKTEGTNYKNTAMIELKQRNG